MDTPQEIEVWYVLPALRREIAIALKKQGLKQKEIAQKLNITEGAVSQYFSSKRATKVVFNSHMKKEIAKSAKNISSKCNRTIQIQRLLKLVKDQGILCKLHRQICGCENLEKCGVCL